MSCDQLEISAQPVPAWQKLNAISVRIGQSAKKLWWGLQVVGFVATAIGAIRLIRLHVMRPKRSQIQLRSGPTLEFAYPSQAPTALVMFGDLIDPEFAFLRSIARPGWVVADVGAAIGQFTLFATGLKCAKVHAFEPSGANIATLRKNISLNGVARRVKINQLAFSNIDGESTFETTECTWMSQLSSVKVPGAEVVAVRTLSGELRRQGIDHLSVLKINVAGFEPKVIDGAMPFLAAGKADILILLLGLPSLKWYKKIARCGYRFFYYHPQKRNLYEVTKFDASSVLDHRPSPARHIIAIHRRAIENGIISSTPIHKL